MPRKPEPKDQAEPQGGVVHVSQFEDFVPDMGPSIDLSPLTAQPESAATSEGASNGE